MAEGWCSVCGNLVHYPYRKVCSQRCYEYIVKHGTEEARARLAADALSQMGDQEEEIPLTVGEDLDNLRKVIREKLIGEKDWWNG